MVNRYFEDGGDICVSSWDQKRCNPMDDPAGDSIDAKAQEENRRIVRRIEITVEREITTVILRRKTESSEPTLPPEQPADKDSDPSS